MLQNFIIDYKIKIINSKFKSIESGFRGSTTKYIAATSECARPCDKSIEIIIYTLDI